MVRMGFTNSSFRRQVYSRDHILHHGCYCRPEGSSEWPGIVFFHRHLVEKAIRRLLGLSVLCFFWPRFYLFRKRRHIIGIRPRVIPPSPLVGFDLGAISTQQAEREIYPLLLSGVNTKLVECQNLPGFCKLTLLFAHDGTDQSWKIVEAVMRFGHHDGCGKSLMN